MEEVSSSSGGGSLSGSDARFFSDSFECSICSEDMTAAECVVTNCGHCFCKACLVGWEQSQVARGIEVCCPQCRRVLVSYEALTWPLFIKSFREELVAKLRKFEREKATLLAEKVKVEEQLAKDRRQQEGLQRTVDDLRNLTVKKNESDMLKLRKQIVELEQTLGNVDKTAKEEKRRELDEARIRMEDLEGQGRLLAQELEKRQRDVEALRQEVAAGAAVLEAKQLELTRLQEREAAASAADAANASAAMVAAESAALIAAAGRAASSPVGELADTLKSYAVGSSYYLSKGWKYATKLFGGKSANLMRLSSDFEMQERRGSHLSCSVWRSVDKGIASENAVCAVKWKRGGSQLDAYREAMILSALSHEHIMPVSGVIDGGDGQIGIVMPFFENDLEYVLAPDNVDGLRLDVGAQVGVVTGLLSALAYAHAQEVVHRNITTNVLMLHENFVVVGGWTDVASLSSPVKMALVGNVRYSAPELLLSAAASPEAVNWKAFDVWAAGCVVWEVLVENSLNPFVACNSSDLREQVRALCSWHELREEARAWLALQERGRFPVLEQELQNKNAPVRSMVSVLQEKLIAPEAIGLVCKMLAWDPAKRITAYNALLDDYLAGNRLNRPSGRDVADRRSLSNAALEEWIAAMK